MSENINEIAGVEPSFKIDELKFNEKGLIPAIVQDHYSKKVLMMAWMNKESLEISLREKKTCFYSRSRQELWRKGETSGNVQHISSIYADCDKDTLIVEVVKEGPACHTGAESCFFDPVYQNEEITPFSYEGLYDLIMGRKTNPKEGSYTTYLFDKGLDKILKKVGEECTEVIIAAAKKDKDETIYELADLCYHAMVLMADAGISVEDVTLYDTITPEESPLAERIRELLKEGAIDAATFTSGSTVQGFLDILQPDKETLNGFTAVCIGEKTEKTASAAGMKAVLAESVSEEGIEQALYHM